MPHWDKESALSQLTELRDGVSALAIAPQYREGLVRWRLNVQRTLSEIFGEASAYYQEFIQIPWTGSPDAFIVGPFASGSSFDPNARLEHLAREVVGRGLQVARGILAAAEDELLEREIEDIYRGHDTAPEASAIIKIVKLAEVSLRKTFRKQPSNEKEVQAHFETLLHATDIQFTREMDRVVYATKTYVPDFVVAHADLAIELKFADRSSREPEMIAEINDDISAYGTRWRNILFVIYDVGTIRDVGAFSEPFENENVLVRVVKH
ncbi:PD-(D/E)XK nuclease domain-containing protein [Nocardia beijingensis]|uniref:Uncharacterized protein n=1 Tax=Nocardia beijingensis TaxID=95162 RepID=A0ABW7WGI3_9NOCA